jgi:diguanylate cyclase (GGDEF)-like protein
MSIRFSILIAIVISMAVAAFAVQSVSSDYLLKNFREIEQQNATNGIERVRQAFDSALRSYSVQSLDWSNWDDSYEFAVTRSPEFIKANCYPEGLSSVELDSIVFLDVKGQIIFSGHSNRFPLLARVDNEMLVTKLEELRAFSGSPSGLTEASSVMHIKGQWLSVVVRPIFDTKKSKPSRGWVVFATVLDPSFFQSIGQTAHYNVRVLFPSAPELKSVEHQLKFEGSALSIMDDDNMAAYSLVRGFGREPILVIKSIMPRQVMQQGRSMIEAMGYQLLLICILVSAVIIAVLDRIAFARLGMLSKQVGEIKNLDGGSRITLRGKDELGVLTLAINRMLEGIENATKRVRDSEEALRRHNEQLEQTILERTREIEHQSLHDKLTGLPNRVLYMDRLTFALTKIRRSRVGIAALFIDLDNFKLVNDSLGHEMGDALLVAVAERLRKAARPSDTVARMGGDEFTILLEDISSPDVAVTVAERILRLLKEPILLGTKETYANASIGIAFTTDPELVEADLLRDADTAMYHAKAAGKSGYRVFDESMYDNHIEHLELQTEIRKALDNKGFGVYYQPLVCLKTRRVLGCEALARWFHAERGQIPPGKFIPIAEEMGAIVQLGYEIMEKACCQAVEWISQYGLEDFKLSVNFSGKQLQRDDAVAQIKGVLERTKLPPQCLKLEITESILIDDREVASAKMKELKALGVCLALDDFGTGYSSLSMLHAFPIDTLKIDQLFINQLEEDEESLAIVSAIIALAHSMNLEVVAEGIETKAQHQRLAKLGCALGQGYLYDRPVPPEQFACHIDQIIELAA